ncbi:MAG: CoB--CoM heterodisulfide reductase iron-sulfur subunit A family protein [Methanomicrobia archaeon]|nr:CoB--CoM heterodisulfide reductase iron-sulfur subunit A family protein [Methanomicrobia archaeon]
MPMGVAVIGGGISGISAALDLAHSGFRVYLIEQRQTLGGKVAELAECKIGLAPWLAEVENHPNIELLLGGTVEALSGTAGDFRLTVSGRVLAVGSIILAPGYEIFENVSSSYNLDHPDVITTLDFERMLRAATKSGELTRPSNGQPVRKISFIQCVGSRCTENELCSTVCCACTARDAKIIRQRFPQVEVAVFYIDLRVFGRDEQLVEELKNDPGVRYIKSRVPEVIPCGSPVHMDTPSGEPLLLKYENFAAGTIEQQAFDLVVIAVGLLPSKTLNELTEILGVIQDPFGYPATSATNPVETSVPGIFVCGCANGPMRVQESVAQGSAAAVKAARFVKRSDQHAETPQKHAPVGEAPRIGVFICGCEGEISNNVDIAVLAERVRSHDTVVHVDTELTTCETAKEKITRGVREHHLNRVVFAGCSPRDSESFLSAACANAGLPPYSLEIANIREQCAWVHTREAATEVAGELITMAIERVRHQPEEVIERYPVIPRALVIGGGVSGMTAALEIATAGYEVTLLEKASELGGALNTVYAFPTGERASDVLARLKADVIRNERVTVYTNAELTDWWGRPGAFTARIRTAGSDEEIECGAVVVAIGTQAVTPLGWLGYGAAKNVVTQAEFSALLAADTAVAGTIVMVQDVVHNEGVYPKYTSIELVTNAIRAKDCNPDAQIFVLYQEMKTYGIGELKYKEAREKGVIFVRYTQDRPPELNAGIIAVFDMVLGEELQIKPDLIVLSTPMVPSTGHEHLHELLGIPMNEQGFFIEARERPRMNFMSVDTPTRGVLVCGSALFPTSLDECIVQAGAAASRACSTILAHEYLTLDPWIARVDELLCRGCGLCAQVCEYNAITLQESDGLPIATVREAICQGCGACAVACPARAIRCRTSTVEQFIAMIEAIA